MLETLLLALPWLRSAEFLRFVESGVVSAAVHYSIFLFCYYVCRFHYQNAATTGLVPAFVVNFLLHKFWTYGSSDLAAALVELPMFSLKKFVFWYLNRKLLFVLVECRHWKPLWAQLLLIPTLGAISYLILQKIFTS